MDFNKWLDPDDEGAFGIANMELLELNCVKELLLVVGDVESFEDKRDITFVAPRQRPWLTYMYMTRTRGKQKNRGLEKLEAARGTWKCLESQMVKQFQDFKDQRAKDRQECVDCKSRIPLCMVLSQYSILMLTSL
jgi:hypothetical protein